MCLHVNRTTGLTQGPGICPSFQFRGLKLLRQWLVLSLGAPPSADQPRELQWPTLLSTGKQEHSLTQCRKDQADSSPAEVWENCSWNHSTTERNSPPSHLGPVSLEPLVDWFGWQEAGIPTHFPQALQEHRRLTDAHWLALSDIPASVFKPH